MWEAINTFGLVVLAALAIYNSRQTKNLQVSINGRLSQLLALTATSAHAEGKEEQRVQDK